MAPLKAKHTPGPWVADYEHGTILGSRMVNGDRGRVANMAVRSTDADAALIAAAPDLLAALRAVARVNWGTDWEAPRASIGRIGTQVREAIAKAEGRA